MTVIGHGIIGASLICGHGLIHRTRPTYFLLFLGAIAAASPDLDVIFRAIGEQKPLLAHRGITHSLGFAFFSALLFGFYLRWARSSLSPRKFWSYALLAFALMASHGLVDALTTRGPKVLLYYPFSVETVRAPEEYRFIPVSLIPFEGVASVEAEKQDLLGDSSTVTLLPRALVSLAGSPAWARFAYMLGVILTEIFFCLPLILLCCWCLKQPKAINKKNVA